MNWQLLKFTLCMLAGLAIGGIIWVPQLPTKAKVEMVVYTAVRLGWVCHDNGVSFDECVSKVRDGSN